MPVQRRLAKRAVDVATIDFENKSLGLPQVVGLGSGSGLWLGLGLQLRLRLRSRLRLGLGVRVTVTVTVRDVRLQQRAL